MPIQETQAPARHVVHIDCQQPTFARVSHSFQSICSSSKRSSQQSSPCLLRAAASRSGVALQLLPCQVWRQRRSLGFLCLLARWSSNTGEARDGHISKALPPCRGHRNVHKQSWSMMLNVMCPSFCYTTTVL